MEREAAGQIPGVKDRFVDMVDAYDPNLCNLARHVAMQYSIAMHDGVYAGLIGPAYESPAEARLLRQMGADAAGMSTVLETIAARALGMAVVGFSLITNVHLTGEPTSHAAVIAASQRGATDVAQLIEGIVANLDAPLKGHLHTVAGGSQQQSFRSTASWTSWHTATLEWTPTSVTFILDGTDLGSTTLDVPQTPMTLDLRAESDLQGAPKPPASAHGSMEIDWLTVYSYAPSS